MIQATIDHDLPCSSDAFWRLFFSREYTEAVYLGALGFPHLKIEKLSEPDGDAELLMEVQPKIALPTPVMKLLGDGFRYREHGKLHRKENLYTFTITPDKLADKYKNSGTIRVVDLGVGQCRRTVSFRVEATVFAIGGMIESSVEKTTRASWEKNAEFTRSYLSKHSP